MSLDATLKAFFDLIREETKQNPEFRNRLESLLLNQQGGRHGDKMAAHGHEAVSVTKLADNGSQANKRGNRRAPALVDPIAEGGMGEVHLREKLATLGIDELRDVVADFRMDPSRLVMKWKDRERVIDHIVTTALERRQKGDAFRS